MSEPDKVEEVEDDEEDDAPEDLKKGYRCQHCGSYVKRYRRKLTSSMAAALLLFHKELVKNRRADWIHFQSFLSTLNLKPGLASSLHGGMTAMLRFWGLLEKHPQFRGQFRITRQGHQFVQGKIKVPKYAHIYNNRKLKDEGPEVEFQETLSSDNKFDYNELMST
jgi:hypothetical protein